MPYPDDLGGVFESDVHRRVMANVPNPDDDSLTVGALLAERVVKDDHLDIDEHDLVDVLKDLEADGYVKYLKDGWKNTPAGFAALTGPPNEGES